MHGIFAVPITFNGTLTADKTWDFKVPFDCQLVSASLLCATNDCIGLVGTSADADAYVNATDGAVTAGTITQIGRTGFVNDQFPHLTKDTQVRVTFDHTGSNPTDFIAVLFFREG